MQKIVFQFILLFSSFLSAQNSISGKIVNAKNQPISDVNVYLENTYDGALTNEKGEFSFTTTEIGNQTLIASKIAFDDIKIIISVENFKNQTIKLKPTLNTIETVVINAGNFKAGDNSKASALKPLDIVTTAGALGDIVGALQTLPGAQINAEDGRLFVRGGESYETQTYIDGIRVAQPYGVTPNNVPTRGRFSPFLFNGMTFSTGGYSAEFGDALSSVLLMNSISEPDQEKTDIGIMSVGFSLGKTKKWFKNSISINSAYINLEPYQKIVPQKLNWNKAFQSGSGEAIYRHKFEQGLFKFYTAFDFTTFDINQEDVNSITPIRVKNNNSNLYLNSSYKGKFGSNFTLTTGGSLGVNKVNYGLNATDLNNQEIASHLKIKIEKKINQHFNLAMGSDYFYTKFNEKYQPENSNSFLSKYNSNIIAVFTELDIIFNQNFATKIGFRGMKNHLLNQSVLEPRISLAYKISKSSQFSFAFGQFNQTPKQEYLKYSNHLNFEKTAHYILNYMYTKNNRTLRTEIYYKDYNQLIKYTSKNPEYSSIYNNSGFGFAKGIDLFWRDNKTFKNTDYWVTYTYIDTERDFKNYPYSVNPTFAVNHTLTLVGKYWIEDWKSQISATNSFASGRPYNNPNEIHFMNSKTKNYNSLSLSWAYLFTTQKIIYFSVSNILGRDNIFGYNYANNPDSNGNYARQTINQPASRFFFIGFFWTISNDKKSNQLNNL